MQEIVLPGRGEEVVAVHITDMVMVHQPEFAEGEWLCYDCAVSHIFPRPLNQEEYLDVAANSHAKLGMKHEFLTASGGEVASDNADSFLGKICEECHTPLGGWHICKFCGVVEFPSEGHACMEFTDAGNAPEDSAAYRLHDDVMSGLDSGFQEDSFTGHVF